MAKHLILGAGPVAAALAARLLASGHDVAAATRSGTQLPGVAPLRLDAADPGALTRAARGSDVIFIGTNPPYHQWAAQWPPLIESAASAAAATGARIVLMGNLYAYGVPDGPMREDSPLRPADTKGKVRQHIWERLQQLQAEGKIQATEVRASDYFGPGSKAHAHLGPRFLRPILESKTAWVVGNPALAHSWAYLPDIAATLQAASVESAMGRAWLVPHSSEQDRLSIAEQVNSLAGSRGRVHSYPGLLWKLGGKLSPAMREIGASSYQFAHRFVVDSRETERSLGVSATPFSQALQLSVEDALRYGTNIAPASRGKGSDSNSPA